MDADFLFQPFDTRHAPATLGAWLLRELDSGEYTDFLAVVAFATASGTARLGRTLQRFNASGGTSHVICGIGNGVTSRQAIEHLLRAGVNVTGFHTGTGTLLFHPKLYRLASPTKGLLVVGSNNLTLDGLFRHFEASTVLHFDRRCEQDEHLLQKPDQYVSELQSRYPNNLLRMSAELLDDEAISTHLIDETRCTPRTTTGVPGTATAPADGGTAPIPPIPVPDFPGADDGFEVPRPQNAAPADSPASSGTTASQPDTGSAARYETLVIQIRPYHTGEVLLSKRAVDQNPSFFGWPFTGLSTTKFSKNDPYPQREPDPVVKLTVYDTSDEIVQQLQPFNLNTVFYSKKSEFRITIPPSLARQIPDYSMLVMRTDSQFDYVMDVYPPGSPAFTRYLRMCDQKMPSGGSAEPRRFGWINSSSEA